MYYRHDFGEGVDVSGDPTVVFDKAFELAAKDAVLKSLYRPGRVRGQARGGGYRTRGSSTIARFGMR